MKVHVVSSCTDRKKVSIAPSRRLRNHRRADVNSAVSRWKEALLSGTDQRTPVRDTYAGEHWVEFLRVVDSRPEAGAVQGWIASAGYGLVPLDSAVVGYAATFSPGSADSVARLGPTGVDWWRSLASWDGPHPGSPRTIRGVVQNAAVGELVVVTASPNYLHAMSEDLLAAMKVSEAGHAADLLVMGTKLPSNLSTAHPDHVVQFGSGLQRLVGGSRIGLNIRVLAKALEEAGGTRDRIRDWVTSANAQYPVLPAPDRDRADDGTVAKFIASRLREAPGIKASPLLREWRDAGKACEQGRFGKIYRRVATQVTESAVRGVRSEAR